MEVKSNPAIGFVSGGGLEANLQVRLNVEELDALTRLAKQRGLPVSTLARDLLLSQLASSDDSAKALIAKIRAELDDLATRVA